ncbi:glycosyltransferase-like protein, family 2 [Leptospira weilii str. 2006001853]|uniref:Glycosyltransferase-like protein, family 2 n=1 Tax=Leptospira weilii str. 2006001853 TaxID=1001589 RepID=A0A828Z4P8_9LEPT|nr:glycosyltransferase [Leptospira weilii]EKR65362.1 glycosyltransferase-like protein, family 2 [Leptospira weilii str. 2006001853]EMN43136.1 glycosyltransferase-like protein, family 2 [Leptospira weilii str. LNT 1234]MCL8265516.1 glycosyltransferase [Leptospira weilii]QDK23657.1 glycosyltransferase [Leptospira weilii]QDK26706.1 glycosyltransferase [Leptospira weilii]
MKAWVRKIFYLLRQYQYYFFLYSKNKNIHKSEYSYRPLISILVPIYNTKRKYLKKMVRSVEMQTYENWELILLDDASPKSEPGNFLKEKGRTNSRIRYFRVEKNGGISVATSMALEYSVGDYIAFLDHDDKLMKDALMTVVDSLQNDDGRPEFLYSDEIFQSKISGVFSLSTKSEFSPERLISYNYICHFVVVSKNLIYRMGGIREGYDGSQDHEFALRACRHTNRIRRLPYFLYVWRLHRESFSRKKAEICEESSKKAILEYYKEKKEKVEKIVPGYYPFTYHPIRRLRLVKLISIVVLDIEAILGNGFQDIYEMIGLTPSDFHLEIFLSVGKNRTKFEIPQSVLKEFQDRVRFKILEFSDSDFSAKNINSIVSDAQGSYILFWNPCFKPKNEDWLYELLQHAQSSGIGAVCPIIFNRRNELIYSSLLLGKKGFIGVAGNGITTAEAKIWSGEFIEKNVSAISRNVFLVSRKNWDLLNGLDESFQRDYWDVDFSLRLLEKNLRIVSNPFSSFISSYTLKRSFREYDPEYKIGRSDQKLLIRKWGGSLKADRFYSPHSDLLGTDMYPRNFFHSLQYRICRRKWGLN